jgi:hypothetical protein
MKAKLTHNYQSVIDRCYSSDKDLLDKWHIIAPTTLNQASLHTLIVFNTSSKFKMYELTEKGRFIGYFGTTETDIKYVQGFFIMPAFRNKAIYDSFFEKIKQVLSSTVIIPVYAKNTRACNFLERNNCTLVHTVEGKDEIKVYKIIEVFEK